MQEFCESVTEICQTLFGGWSDGFREEVMSEFEPKPEGVKRWNMLGEKVLWAAYARALNQKRAQPI